MPTNTEHSIIVPSDFVLVYLFRRDPTSAWVKYEDKK